MNWKERANQLKINIPAVFLALNKKETPWVAKIFAAITVVYALSPIDFIPDFIPVLGYLDDILLLPVLTALTLCFIPKPLFAQCQAEAKDLVEGLPCTKWYYAIPIFLLWVAILFWVAQILR